jgi:TRAP transporter TAXI family solute receptor
MSSNEQSAGTARRVPPPRIERSFTISFKGDWGRANLHRVCGWLGYELLKLSGPHSEFAIWNGRSGLDNVQAVGRGKVDVALSVPVSFMRMAAEGKGPCAGEAFPHMRAIGYVPQNDRMVMAIRRDLGITSFAELRDKKPKLRIAAGLDDGVSFMGMGARMLMEAHGISRQEFASWGGSYVEFEEPRRCTNAVLVGNADAIIQEAVMNSYWTELANKVDLAFLPIEPEARDRIARDFGLTTATLPKDYLRGIDREMEFMDFSHFLLLTTTDLPDDIAYALAWSLIEQFGTLQGMYSHLAPDRSPISYPIDPKGACRTLVPLHPGAERYYRDAGHLE